MFPSIHTTHRYVRPTSTTPPGQYDVMILIALLQDLFWEPAAQGGFNLVS